MATRLWNGFLVLLRVAVCGYLTWNFSAVTFVLYKRHLLHATASDQVWSPAITLLVFACGAAFMASLTLGRSLWRGLLWADRVGLIGLAYFSWQFRDRTSKFEWGVLGAAAIAGLITHHVAHRHALGWMIDEHGERQKIEHFNRGRAVSTPTTWRQRMKEEAQERSKRRWIIFWYGLAGGGLGYAAYSLQHSPTSAIFAFFPAVFGAIFALGFAAFVGLELLYLLGYQDMKGHKVLDREPNRPGIEKVASEKAHGDASIASEADALGMLGHR